MPAKRKSVEVSIKKQTIDWIATAGGGVPSRAEANFRQRGWQISASMFRQWWHGREQILAEAGSRRRMGGGGRKPVLGEAEDTLVELAHNRRISKEKVTRDWIADQARLLFLSSRTEEEHEESPIRFVVSGKWIDSFLKRNNLSLRRRANLTTLSDDELAARAVSFMQYLSEHKGEMNLPRTVLMGETAVYFEDARTSTIADTCNGLN